MYGIQKGTVNINLVNAASNAAEPVNVITPSTADAVGLNAIYANPCKAFGHYRVTFDAAVTAVNVTATINDRITEWIGLYGNRYDDILININPSGANHDITVTIIRN
jgi:hypothetical protein